MADYEFRYRLNVAPEARNDGSGQVAHDIEAVSRVQGSGDPWSSAPAVPSHHETILLPADELLVVLAMPNNGAKVVAYQALLVLHRADAAMPFITQWQVANMEAFMDANDLSIAAAAGSNTYITVDLGLAYPITFSL